MSGLSRSSHALVTGGGSGIGRAIAASLAQAGSTVTILGRNRAVLDDVVAAGDAHFAIAADVSDQAALNGAIADAAPMLVAGEDERYQAEVMRLAPAEKLDPRAAARES